MPLANTDSVARQAEAILADPVHPERARQALQAPGTNSSAVHRKNNKRTDVPPPAYVRPPAYNAENECQNCLLPHELARHLSMKFIVLSTESTGIFDKELRKLVRDLGKLAKDAAGISADCFMESLRRDLGTALARGNGACIYNATHEAARKKARIQTDWDRLGDLAQPLPLYTPICADGT